MDATTQDPMPPRSAPDYRETLTVNYPIIERVVRQVARRRRLGADEAEELGAAVCLKLVERNYAVLSTFEERSSLGTYLTRVVDRVCLDSKIAMAGRWRPSAQARRLGATAVRLERLLIRDRVSFDEACEMLRVNFRVTESRGELERMRAALPPRRARPRHCSIEHLQRCGTPKALRVDPSAGPGTVHESRPDLRQLRKAVLALPVSERRLLHLHFYECWTIARIARTLRCDQPALYRRFERIYASVRASVEGGPVKTGHRPVRSETAQRSHRP